ncbi:hypothetical protein [Mycobacterium sp. DL592]|nr:hypothetical protein [Mycobacterium sp. DL592]
MGVEHRRRAVAFIAANTLPRGASTSDAMLLDNKIGVDGDSISSFSLAL